jgi:anti-sigma regulatory factor (Ser/Thr protein kinase)
MKSELIIKSDFKLLDEVYEWLENFLINRINKKTLRNILLVMQEMVTNSILHGNKKLIDKEVSLEVSMTSTHIILEISDEGEGLKQLPSQKEAKDLSYLEENGRGLKLAVLLTESIKLEGSKTKYIFRNE